MSKKYISLEHSIRLTLTEGGVGFGTKGGDKARGTSSAFYNSYSSKGGGHSAAGARVAAKDAGKENIKMEEDAGVPNEGNATPTAKAYGSFDEDGKKKKTVKEGIVDSALKMGGRLGSKAVPGLGQGLSAADAASRYASGDTTGAAISAAGAIPYISSVTGPVGDVINTVRDVTGMSTPSSSSNNSADVSNIPDTPGQAPQTTGPKTSVGGQTPTKKLKKTVKEETGPDNTRRKNSSKELVGRPNSAGVKRPDSVLARNASVKEKIIAENKKLVGIVKKTKEEKEQESAGPNITTKTKDMGNVVFNPPLKKPDVGSYNN